MTILLPASGRAVRGLFGALAGAAWMFAAGSLPAAQPPGAPAPAAEPILRYEPLADRLEPVATAELKPGCVYNHFSQRLGRRAWSVHLGGGAFGHGLGPGTTIDHRFLDLRMGREERLKRLRELAPEVAEEMERLGEGEVNFRLGPDETWRFVGANLAVMLFDAETGCRFERLFARYVPVVHTDGDQWTYREGRYLPALSGGPSTNHVLVSPDDPDGCQTSRRGSRNQVLPSHSADELVGSVPPR